MLIFGGGRVSPLPLTLSELAIYNHRWSLRWKIYGNLVAERWLKKPKMGWELPSKDDRQGSKASLSCISPQKNIRRSWWWLAGKGSIPTKYSEYTIEFGEFKISSIQLYIGLAGHLTISPFGTTKNPPKGGSEICREISAYGCRWLVKYILICKDSNNMRIYDTHTCVQTGSWDVNGRCDPITMCSWICCQKHTCLHSFATDWSSCMCTLFLFCSHMFSFQNNNTNHFQCRNCSIFYRMFVSFCKTARRRSHCNCFDGAY